MKLVERLYLGDSEAKIIDTVCSLAYRSPGTATILTDRAPNMQQVIAYECGYDNTIIRYFMGYVESYKQINNNVYSLFCRELSAALRQSLPLSIQHVTLRDVLSRITTVTGLQFVIPDQDYTNTPAPHVISQSTGYALMDNLGDVFNIDSYIWQQQGDGRIFVGSWKDSTWNGKNIPVPHQFIENAQINTAQIPMHPTLRPGIMINGQRVRNIELNKTKMQITWMSK